MAATIDQRRQEAERLRDYFDVQLLFAETVVDRTSLTLSNACLKFTNLHRRFGLGRVDSGIPSPEWTRYAAGLEKCATSASRLEWTVTFFAGTRSKASVARSFGCFGYELLNPEPVVRIHFSNRDSADGRGPLTRAKVDRRMAELREMFQSIRVHHSSAQSVRGSSWLYNLEAYRRLFPPAYTASVYEPETVLLDGTSSWGQILDFRGSVKPAVRRALLENIKLVDIAAPWRAFPMRALAAQTSIEHFHQFYSC